MTRDDTAHVLAPPLIDAAQIAAAAADPATIRRVIDALAEAFGDLSAGRTQSPPRTIVAFGRRQELLAATALWERRGVGTVKVTTISPDNPRRGLPLINGLVVLTDLESGRISALLDGAQLSALRTGAVVGLATRLCAPHDAAHLAVIGAGVQARAAVRAVTAVRPITAIRVSSRTRDSAQRLADWIRTQPAHRHIKVEVCDSVEKAVAHAAIVCTTTSTAARTPLVAARWVAPGAHVNVVGGTHEDALEIEPALLASAFVLVEQRRAALAEAGEVRRALADGLIRPDALTELGDLVNGAPGPADGQTSVLRSVGLAIEDTAAAAILADPGGAAGTGGAAR